MPSGRQLANVLPCSSWRQLRPAMSPNMTQPATRPGASCRCQGANCCGKAATASRRSFYGVNRRTNPLRRHEGDKNPSSPSIFEELFPDAKVRLQRLEAETHGEDGPLQAEYGTGLDTQGGTQDPDRPKDVLRLLAESRGGAALNGEPPSSGLDGGVGSTPVPAILVLSGTTTSLLPSDFFRIAPRVVDPATPGSSSGSIEGWTAAAGGLYKVVQDRDPATLMPRGRYFLHFGSSAAALAYAQEVRDLHRLARQAIQPRLRHASMARFRSGGYDASGTTEGEEAALRDFTLVPPTSRLDLMMHMDETNGQKEYKPASGSATLTTKVLVALSDTATGSGVTGESSGNPNDSQSGVATVDGLRDLIAADGAVRNLPWAVSDGLNGVVPVQWLVLAEQDRKSKNKRNGKATAAASAPSVPDLRAKTEQMNDQAAYGQFVVAFSDAVEARRFVRSWHRRMVSVPKTDGGQTVRRRVMVDATVLW